MGCLIAMLGMGARSSFGLFTEPVTQEDGLALCRVWTGVVLAKLDVGCPGEPLPPLPLTVGAQCLSSWLDRYSTRPVLLACR